MDRGAWWATVHGVARVRHDLVTKPPPHPLKNKQRIINDEKNLKTELLFALGIPYWAYNLRKPKLKEKNTCTPMFNAVLFMTVMETI